MPKPSWRLKFDRAEEHLNELKELLGTVAERKPHAVRESFETNSDESWIYRLDLGPKPDGGRAAILAGDCLFNLRSGLDHLAVAIAPPDRKAIADFPILTDDPFAQDSGGEYVHQRARNTWLRTTKGMRDEAIAAFMPLQPYYQARRHGGNADDHALAILAALQNADKHRELVLLVNGMSKSRITVNGDTRYVVPILPDGMILDSADHRLEVEAMGSAHVAFGLGGKGAREFPLAFDTIRNMITVEVLPLLEPLARM